MPLKSMTGFGRAGGQENGASWVWELRTVNGRGLDLRFRLPPGFEAFELRLREHVGKSMARGNCAISPGAQCQPSGLRCQCVTTTASAKEGSCTANEPSGFSTKDAPSNTSSSCPPT